LQINVQDPAVVDSNIQPSNLLILRATALPVSQIRGRGSWFAGHPPDEFSLF
jgi:hypothetical protein